MAYKFYPKRVPCHHLKDKKVVSGTVIKNVLHTMLLNAKMFIVGVDRWGVAQGTNVDIHWI